MGAQDGAGSTTLQSSSPTQSITTNALDARPVLADTANPFGYVEVDRYDPRALRHVAAQALRVALPLLERAAPWPGIVAYSDENTSIYYGWLD